LRPVNPTQAQIRSAIPNIFLTKKQAGYVVYSLADKAQSKTKAVELRANRLEHIFPENAEQTDWPRAEEMEPFIWHIGNVTVLEPTYNRDAGRKSYNTKKVIYAKSEIAMTTDIAKSYDSWDMSHIVDRANKFLSLIGQVWPETI
jgi:uncharacterized protein DUF1524